MSFITESSKDSQRGKPCFGRNLGKSSGLVAFGVAALLFAGSVTLALQTAQPTPDDKEARLVTKEPIEIRVKDPAPAPRLYRFDDQKHEKAELSFIGDGQTWSFIKFAPLPAGTKLRAKGNSGYQTAEELTSDEWYPFKQRLSVTLEIDSGAHSPVDVSFSVGNVKSNRQDFLNTLTSVDSVRNFAKTSQNEINPEPSPQSLDFKWGTATANPPGTTDPVTMSPVQVKLEVPDKIGEAPYQKTTLVSDGKHWTFVRASKVPEGIVLVARPSTADSLTVESGTLIDSAVWIGFRNSLTLEVTVIKSKVAAKGSEDIVFETAVGQAADQTKQEAIAAIKSNTMSRSNNVQLNVSWGPETDESLPWLKIGLGGLALLVIAVGIVWLVRRARDPRRRARAPRLSSNDALHDYPFDDGNTKSGMSGTRDLNKKGRDPAGTQGKPASAGILDLSPDNRNRSSQAALRRTEASLESPADLAVPPPTSSNSFDQKQLEQLIDEQMQPLRSELKQKPTDQELRSLASDVGNLDKMVREQGGRIQQQVTTQIHSEVTTQIQSVKDLITQQSQQMEQKLRERDGRIDRTANEGEAVKKQLEESLSASGQMEARMRIRLSELQATLERRTVPDSFYSRILGGVLGQQIEALQDGNFEKLMGEQLDQFFRNDVSRGEKLQELRIRAEGISLALSDVLIQMQRLNQQASSEARQPMQRVEAFVNELSGLQSQMQSRRATIETTLHIPVSMHAGARQTFLDELGRGIKREIDKLNDPVSYFEGELERTITADLIAIVDICDKTVAPPPGSRPDLETALKQLFEQAGLRQILPHQNEQLLK